MNAILIVGLRTDHVGGWSQDSALLQPVHVTACNCTNYYYYYYYYYIYWNGIIVPTRLQTCLLLMWF